MLINFSTYFEGRNKNEKNGGSFYWASEGQPLMDGGPNGISFKRVPSMSEGYPIMDGSGATGSHEADYWKIDEQLMMPDTEREINTLKPIIDRKSIPQEYSLYEFPSDTKVEKPEDGDVFYTMEGRTFVDKGGHGGFNEGVWEEYTGVEKCPRDPEMVERKDKGLVPGSQAWKAVEEIHYRRMQGKVGKPGPYERRGPHAGEYSVELPPKLENRKPIRENFIRDRTPGIKYKITETSAEVEPSDGKELTFRIIPGQPGAQMPLQKSIRRVENVKPVQYRVLDGPPCSRGMYHMILLGIETTGSIKGQKTTNC